MNMAEAVGRGGCQGFEAEPRGQSVPRRSQGTRVVAIALMVIIVGVRSVCAQGPERPEFITAEADRAIEKGLAFLARTQSRDGSWQANGGYGGGYPTAMTALAGLALLSGGNTPMEGKYTDNVNKAIDYLLSNSTASGVIARMDQEQSCMHGHGFAMHFLAEAYGMGRDGDPRQKKIATVLKKAIKLTQESQSPQGGWLYTPNSNSDEGSVTVTQIQGLRACRNAGIKVPKSIIDKACDYIDKSKCSDGGIAYRVGQGGSRPPITAAAVAVMYSAGQYDHEVAKGAKDYVKRLLKANRHSLDGGHKFYAMLYTAQAMYHDEDDWKWYFPPVRDDLVGSQSSAGSWEGDGVGDIYGTSIGLIVLQLPYGHLPSLQR